MDLCGLVHEKTSVTAKTFLLGLRFLLFLSKISTHQLFPLFTKPSEIFFFFFLFLVKLCRRSVFPSSFSLSLSLSLPFPLSLTFSPSLHLLTLFSSCPKGVPTELLKAILFSWGKKQGMSRNFLPFVLNHKGEGEEGRKRERRRERERGG